LLDREGEALQVLKEERAVLGLLHPRAADPVHAQQTFAKAGLGAKRAIHPHQLRIAPAGRGVEQLRHGNLAGTVLTLQEDGRAHGGELLHLLDELFDYRARAGQTALDILGLRRRRESAVSALALKLLELDAAPERRDELIDAERLLQVVKRAKL